MSSTPINSAVAGLNAPPIPIVQNSAKDYDGRLGDLIDLSQAVPGYAIHPKLADHLQAAAARSDLLGYGPIEGETALRDAYSSHLSNIYDAPVSATETHITSGCNQAFVAAALTVAGPGETVLLITPFYFNHATTLSMLGIRTKSVAARAENNFLPDPEQLAAAITPDVKAIACVTPNNPTGTIYPPALLEQVFDLCAERNIWLMVDETYRDFLGGGEGNGDQQLPHTLLQRPNWRDHFIGLYSFSKSFCIPGHRLGAITAGETVINAVSKVMDNLQICAPRPPQHAVAETLESLAAWRAENCLEIQRRRKALVDVMATCAGWEIATIGAYFSYVKHPFSGRSSTDIAQYLARERGVVTLPGAFFGEDQDAYLRFAFANATAGELSRLDKRIGDI
ncbi:MAG: aminotransferase [Rhizobiaceae bacterium]